MRIKTVRLTKFKRFDDLTIDLGDQPAKVVALVGPNGCGKSSVFDAFEQLLQNHVGVNTVMEPWFYSKSWFDVENPVQNFNKHEAIVAAAVGDTPFNQKSFYVRSAYRFTPRLQISAIQSKGDPITDSQRPGSSSALDQRLQNNYERLHGRLVASFYEGKKTGDVVRNELVGDINTRLGKVLDIRISNLGEVVSGKGQLYFEKGSSKDFPYENLSAGEKEVVDLIIDLEVKRHSFDDTVFCIDEPELHLNTAIQRKLLTQLADLIPDNCQLWVATHSIGFLRALQQDLAEESQVLDFSEKEYFQGEHVIRPMKPTRANWKRIFGTALEDLTGLLAPEKIIYCEGRPDPAPNGDEQGLDAIIYNQVFESTHPEALFISSGGGGEMIKHSALAMKVLGKAFSDVELFLLKDLDQNTPADRQAFLAAAPENRMLRRLEIENYLFDAELLSAYCQANGIPFDQKEYSTLVTNIVSQDLKAGQTIQRLRQMCGFLGNNTAFKLELAKYISPAMAVCTDLEGSIF